MSDRDVRAFRDDLMASIAPIYGDEGPGNSPWESMSDKAQEAWRARYVAARKHFTEPVSDDKVRAYLNRVLLNKVGDMYRITDFDRDEYARAAEFFQGEQ